MNESSLGQLVKSVIIPTKNLSRYTKLIQITKEKLGEALKQAYGLKTNEELNDANIYY